MSNDPLRIFEPGFSDDTARSEQQARTLIDAWRDEWHLEPEPDMDDGNSKVYESLVTHVSTALDDAATRMRDLCVEKVKALRDGFTIEMDTGRLVVDPDGPWFLKSKIVKALESLTLEATANSVQKDSEPEGVEDDAPKS